MRLSEAIIDFLIVCHAERMKPQTAAAYRAVLIDFWKFAGEIEVAHLEAIHILIFVSAEKIMGIKRGEQPTSPSYLLQYAVLRHFTRWLSAQKWVDIDLPKRPSRPASPGPGGVKKGKPRKAQHPPLTGGCCAFSECERPRKKGRNIHCLTRLQPLSPRSQKPAPGFSVFMTNRRADERGGSRLRAKGKNSDMISRHLLVFKFFALKVG